MHRDQPLNILGIESSCDDTSICILQGLPGIRPPNSPAPQILSLNSFSQEILLGKWGGVVPEIAARNHLIKLAPLLEKSLKESNLSSSQIHAVGVTTTPGLLGPLLTGLNAAKTFSLYHKVPLIPVNHLYAHIEAIHLIENIELPYLGLVISGGHALFLLVKSPSQMEILGTTIDDAPGEAFDKGGKLLGLGYPAGKKIDALSQQGDKEKYSFPIGLKKSADANFSYSGVKTALRQFLEKNPHIEKEEKELPHICASYQEAIIKAIKLKSRYALRKAKEITGHEVPFVIGGGVASNRALRKTLQRSYKNIHFVPPKFCTDNGAMIAHYALRIYESHHIPFPQCLDLDARGRYIDKDQVQQTAQKK